MRKLREAIVVEGRYDKIALEPLVDTEIFTTEGFGIFKNKERLSLLRRVAEKRGLIVLTDADGAGLMIRNRLRAAIPEEYLKHAYIPSVSGKERRKASPSRSGMLGVEGMTPEVLEEALHRAGAGTREDDTPRLTKAELFTLGLSGGKGSAERRRAVQRMLSLPENLSANALLDAVNSLYTRDEFLSAVKLLQKEGGEVPAEENPCGAGFQLGGQPVEAVSPGGESTGM